MSSIYKKILEVQKAVMAIPKTGYNSFNNYHYATEADVLKVKELMNGHGLIAYPSVERFETYNRGESIGILQHIKYTVVDVDTRESIECFVLGAGEDKGDKGAYKASTGGNKYFYLKFAGAPTGDDPERDEQPSKPSKGNGRIMHIPATGPTTVADYKNAICELKSRKGWEWEFITEVTGEASVLKLNDTSRLSTALNKLMERAL